MYVLWICILLGAPASAGELKELTLLMTGSFSSAAQAEADPDFYDIRLEMVRIWPQRSDAVWLYVEQAAATHLDQPYRQRVYRVTREQDGSYRSAVFTFAEPLRFAGSFRNEQPLKELSPDDLTIRKGCDVILRRSDDGAFRGSTVDRECESTRGGASYATSVVTILPDRIESWDQGFDAEGVQVWGAVKAGYEFLRQ